MSSALEIVAPYLAPADRAARVRALAEQTGAELRSIGSSVDGESIDAIRMPSTNASPVRLLCTANIHGVEWVSGLVALGLVEHLASDDESVRALRDRAELWIVPCLNPDGYRRTWEKHGVGPLASLRANSHGVDLNRNYPLPAGKRRLALPGAGSANPGDATYFGPSPLSEPETRALDELCTGQQFHAATGLHSFMGTLIPARVQSGAAWRGYGSLCRAFSRAQGTSRYRRLASRWIDAWTGEQEDWLHHGHDCWAICVETFSLVATLRQHWRAPSKFWRFNPRAPERWITQDARGLVAYYNAALELPRPKALETNKL